MDRRFLALIGATFVVAFAVCWIWFAPAVPAPVAQAASPAPAATPSPPPDAASPPPSQDPPPPAPSYKPEPDPTVVHRLG